MPGGFKHKFQFGNKPWDDFPLAAQDHPGHCTDSAPVNSGSHPESPGGFLVSVWIKIWGQTWWSFSINNLAFWSTMGTQAWFGSIYTFLGESPKMTGLPRTDKLVSMCIWVLKPWFVASSSPACASKYGSYFNTRDATQFVCQVLGVKFKP